MTNSRSCSSCGLMIAEESRLTVCPTCLRAMGNIADDGTINEKVRESAATATFIPTDPSSEFVVDSDRRATHFELKHPIKSAFASLTGWEQAQIVELGTRGYRVLSKLGDGGFGVVFLATDAAERPVAIKMLHAGLCDHRYRQRFAVEANALTRLEDPALVKLYHYDVSGADPMLVTEYVPGGTLAKLLHTRPVFGAAEAVEAIHQLATVVHKVHGVDVVHRDIKPSNILIDANGRMKLGDFGLAKRLDRDDDLTPTGRSIGGTPEYSAPEQFRSSGDCDGRADVYALGATLYRLLTGKPVFERKNEGDFVGVILRVLTEQPTPPRKLNPSVPRELEAVCLKCLQKNPADRYKSAAELAADLKAWQTGSKDMIARPSTLAQRTWDRARRLPKFPVAMAIVLVALLLFGAAMMFKPREQDTIDVMNQKLAKEGRVELMAAKGKPPWHKWGLGGPELINHPGDEQGASFEAIDHAALELFPNVPADHFKVIAEIRFGSSAEPRNVRAWAGLFVAGERFETESPNPKSGYVLTGVKFEDGTTQFKNDDQQVVSAQFVRTTQKSVAQQLTGLGHQDFTPSAILPGPWRKYEIEVWPDKIIARVVTGAAATTYNTVTKDGAVHLAALQEPLTWNENDLQTDPEFRGVRFPRWNHRGAVGIWADRASVDFRNVSLIILP